MFPRHQTAFRWANVCLSAGSDSSGLGCVSTTDRGSLRLSGICDWHQQTAARRGWLMYQGCLLGVAPKSLTCLLCERFPTAAMLNNMFYALMLSFLKLELFFSFLLYCYLQNHLLPRTSPLLFERQLHDSKEIYSRLILLGICISICLMYFCI